MRFSKRDRRLHLSQLSKVGQVIKIMPQKEISKWTSFLIFSLTTGNSKRPIPLLTRKRMHLYNGFSRNTMLFDYLQNLSKLEIDKNIPED